MMAQSLALLCYVTILVRFTAAAVVPTFTNYPVTPFFGISSSIGATIDVTFGDVESVRIESTIDDPTYVSAIRVDVLEGTLRLYFDSPVTIYKFPPEAMVRVFIIARPHLRSFMLSGSGPLTVNSVLTAPTTDFIVSTGGTIRAVVNNEQTTVSVSGSGMVTLAGISPRLSATVSGAGVVDAEKLITDDATVAVLGMGSVTVNARRNLATSLTGMGTIRYFGKPALASKIHVGSGKIIQMV